MVWQEESIGVPVAFRELGFKPKFYNFSHGRKSCNISWLKLPLRSVCKAVSPHKMHCKPEGIFFSFGGDFSDIIM